MATKSITITEYTGQIEISDIDFENEFLIEIIGFDMVESRMWVNASNLKTLKDHIDYLYDKTR